jgi:hypothetical protein
MKRQCYWRLRLEDAQARIEGFSSRNASSHGQEMAV